MVFGNMGDDCATGVAFTRDPATGEKVFYGEYLINAQGEDVVAGIRTPKKIAELQKDMPDVYKQLDDIRDKLEKHYRDVQDIEFTIQKGKLWMLQTRNGKRTGFAAVRFAVDMVDEGLITKEEALSVEPHPAGRPEPALAADLRPEAKEGGRAKGKLLAKGINAGPGAATGASSSYAEDAEEWVHKHGQGQRPDGRVILVRRETSPEDIRGMQAADGILTAFGGASSHAALVSRQMGKVCIVGCSALQIDYDKGTVTVGDKVLKEGDFISIDGFTGEVIAGQVATKPSEVVQVLIDKTLKPEQSQVYQQFAELMDVGRRGPQAEGPHQRRQARPGGPGHRLRGRGHRPVPHRAHVLRPHRAEMREMILAETPEAAKKALAKLLPFQRADFEGLFQAMKGLPVTIRTARPAAARVPAARRQTGQAEMAKKLGVPAETIADRVKELHEFNPMLGFRGCRLGIVYPEITAMQAGRSSRRPATCRRQASRSSRRS